jgi:hypothetical protein
LLHVCHIGETGDAIFSFHGTHTAKAAARWTSKDVLLKLYNKLDSGWEEKIKVCAMIKIDKVLLTLTTTTI